MPSENTARKPCMHNAGRDGAAAEPLYAGASQAPQPYEHAIRAAAARHAAAGLSTELPPRDDALAAAAATGAVTSVASLFLPLVCESMHDITPMHVNLK